MDIFWGSAHLIIGYFLGSFLISKYFFFYHFLANIFLLLEFQSEAIVL